MTDAPRRTPRRWEYVASAIVTALSTAALAVSVDFGELSVVVKQLPAPPGWLQWFANLPAPVWWVGCFALGASLFWLGAVLARRWGTLALFMAPVVLVALSFAVPWAAYAPVRDALPALP